jgi:hypothetical protein
VATNYGYLDSVLFVPTAGALTDWTVSAAVQGFLTPASAGAVNGITYRYRAQSADLSQWEYGEGAYNTTGPVLARTTIRLSSAANAKVNFSAAPQVGLIYSVEDAFDSFVNPTTVTGTTYTTVIADLDGWIVFTTAASCAVTLSTAGAIGYGWHCHYTNALTTGLVTFTPASGTIDGAANMTLDPQCVAHIAFDGTNFRNLITSDGGTF